MNNNHTPALVATFALISASLLSVGCGYRYTNPVVEMRARAAAEFSCDDDIELMHMQPTPYADEHAYRATGCGRETWFVCEAEGALMTCHDREGAVYASPAPGGAQATVKVAALFGAPLVHDARVRRHEVRIGDALIRTSDTEGVRAIPVAPGRTRWSYRSADVDIVRELRPFHWFTDHTYRSGNYEYTTTQMHTGLHETSVPVERTSCRTDFTLDARPGATYRILYEYSAQGRCAVHCAEEVAGDGGVVAKACEGFGA